MADPMYRQIAEDLRHRIQSGELPAGAQLPTELELRERYQASRNTIRDAIRWLIQRGLVASQAGRGTFVVDKIQPFVVTLSADPKTGFGGGEGVVYVTEAMTQGRTPVSSEPRVEIQRASAEIARYLEIDKDEQVVSRHQQRHIDGRPWSLQTSLYPMSLVQKGATELILAADIKPGVVAYLHEKLGLEQAGYRDVITVRTPDEVENAFFRLAATGTLSVLHTTRTAYDQHGMPFRVTITAFPGDRNQLAFNVGRVPPRVAAPATGADGPAERPGTGSAGGSYGS